MEDKIMHWKTTRQASLDLFSINNLLVYGPPFIKILFRFSFNSKIVSGSQSGRLYKEAECGIRTATRFNIKCQGIWNISKVYSTPIVQISPNIDF